MTYARTEISTNNFLASRGTLQRTHRLIDTKVKVVTDGLSRGRGTERDTLASPTMP